ncbi:MAG: glycosyltransferase family 39 protein, partial [Anaerolineae bacterium]|nr:glycosyltransferase family 39 protein [Anaerolineae bacterium]
DRGGGPVSQPRNRSHLLLAGLLVVFVLLATWYSLTIPLGEAPDEVPHFTYIRYLARSGRLPTTEEEHEAFQPPLYYALGAALTFWIEDDPGAPFAVRANAHYDVTDPRAPKNLLLHTSAEAWPYRGWALAWHLVRLLSIALGAVTVWAAYQLGRVLFPAQPAVPLAMAALTAFTPQFLFMSAVVNNDNAATAFSALVLWQVAVLFQEGHCSALWKRSALLGLLVGLGLLSKANLIALLPVVGLAVVVSSASCRTRAGDLGGPDPRRRAILAAGGLALAFGLAALASGWYFVRNWILYGDPLGWSFLLEINARREGPLTLDVLGWLFKGVFRSFWLGWIGIQFDEVIYWLIGAACAAGALGFGIWLLRRWRTLGGGTRWTLLALGLQAAITLASLVQWTATVLGTDQGRLIYPILPAVMLVLVSGWAWWARGRSQPWVLGGLAIGMLALAILTPIRYIAPVHAAAPIATGAELSAATPLNVDWDGIRLLGYRLENNRAQPGGKLVLDLYWQALQPVEQDLMALIQLVDQEGRFLMYVDGSPTAGRDTTDRWPPGQPLASRHLLPIPDYGQPGTYRLTISVHPFGEQAWLPAVGPDGTVLGDQLVLPETISLVAP